jgi:hypothetical protein
VILYNNFTVTRSAGLYSRTGAGRIVQPRYPLRK